MQVKYLLSEFQNIGESELIRVMLIMSITFSLDILFLIQVNIEYRVREQAVAS